MVLPYCSQCRSVLLVLCVMRCQQTNGQDEMLQICEPLLSKEYGGSLDISELPYAIDWTQLREDLHDVRSSVLSAGADFRKIFDAKGLVLRATATCLPSLMSTGQVYEACVFHRSQLPRSAAWCKAAYDATSMVWMLSRSGYEETTAREVLTELIQELVVRTGWSGSFELGWPLFFLLRQLLQKLLLSVNLITSNLHAHLQAACPTRSVPTASGDLRYLLNRYVQDPNWESGLEVLRAMSIAGQAKEQPVLCPAARATMLVFLADFTWRRQVEVASAGELSLAAVHKLAGTTAEEDRLLHDAQLAIQRTSEDAELLSLDFIMAAVQFGEQAGWPLWELLEMHEFARQHSDIRRRESIHGFCPAWDLPTWQYDTARVNDYIAVLEDHGTTWQNTEALSAIEAGSRIVTSIPSEGVAVAFILGCDEHSSLSQVLVQVEAIRTLRHSILRLSAIRPRKFWVLATEAIPVKAHSILIACNFSIRFVPSVEEGFGTQDRPLFQELFKMWRAGLYPSGWWWGWLKLRLAELTEEPWVLFLDSDMLAVGSLDSLLSAPFVGSFDTQADFVAVYDADEPDLNTGLMLLRTGKMQAIELQTHTSRLLADFLHAQVRQEEHLTREGRRTEDMHEQVVRNVILRAGVNKGLAVFEAQRLVRCTDSDGSSNTQESEEALAPTSDMRWCALPRQFNAVLPSFWTTGLGYGPPAVEPLVLLHFTGHKVIGRPWEKRGQGMSVWDHAWWNEHSLMCSEAGTFGEPPCSVTCAK